MDLSKVVTALFGLALIVFALVAAIEFLVPLHQKIQFDQLCRDVIYQVNVSEGLSQELRSELVTNLSALGLKEIQIACPEEGQLNRRERRVFKVLGKVDTRVIGGFFEFETKERVYEYNGWVFGKRIIN